MKPCLFPRALRASVSALAALLAFLAVPAHLSAQTAGGTLTGRVLNEGTGEYLRNAVVTVVGTPLTTVAEAGGAYTLPGVPAGIQRVLFSYEGLDPKEETVTVLPGQTVTVDVKLTSAAYDRNIVQLGKFVVASEREGNAKAIMEQKHAIESKRVLATDTFGSISEGNVGEFLKYLPGVHDRLRRGRRPLRQPRRPGSEVHLRHARRRAARQLGHGRGQRRHRQPRV
jgi:iron complex outermembrane receptor protein